MLPFKGKIHLQNLRSEVSKRLVCRTSAFFFTQMVDMFACSLVGRIVFFTCLCGLITKGVSGCQPVSVVCEDIKTKDGFKYDYDCNCGPDTRCTIDVFNEKELLIGTMTCGQQGCQLKENPLVVVGIYRNNTVLKTCLDIKVQCTDHHCWNFTADFNDTLLLDAHREVGTNHSFTPGGVPPENNTKIYWIITAIVVFVVFVVFAFVFWLLYRYRKLKTPSDATCSDYLRTIVQRCFSRSPAEHDQNGELGIPLSDRNGGTHTSAVNGGAEPTSGADQPLTAPEGVSLQNGSAAAY
ncbi:uncharacterized protein LOC133555803 isoform X2 [Nerophis ophidion]|uniref:uncharacterized protein LOC133555803 isoform X2 n=1 Tax=Nerophis ophidion TaxID=159077 RepID=UPI002ADF1528|nr:uncharacterized protein LOC133555803 isoform X2 [Nerophis ophidion]